MRGSQKKRWGSEGGFRECRLAKFYGLNPFALDSAEKHALDDGIPRLRAERKLWSSWPQLEPDEAKQLALVAYRDEEKAEEVWLKRAEDHMRQAGERDLR